MQQLNIINIAIFNYKLIKRREALKVLHADQINKNLWQENRGKFIKPRRTFQSFRDPALKHCGVT